MEDKPNNMTEEEYMAYWFNKIFPERLQESQQPPSDSMITEEVNIPEIYY